MSAPNTLRALMVIVMLMWIGLGLLRQSGVKLIQKIEQSYREYYLTYSDEPADELPLVRWDFERNQLIAIPTEEVEEIEGGGGLRALGVKADNQRLPLSAYGTILARISGAWFHGIFAAASLVIFVSLWRIRAG